MIRSSRLTTWQVLAILVITLGIFGPSAMQAQDKHNEGCHQNECKAPVLEKPAVAAPCCPKPVVKETCAPPPAPSCCPVDPKDVKKAQKANEHAQHEAAEACKRQQRAAEKAQQKIDAAYQQGNQKIDDATAKVNQRYSEWQDAYAKLNSLNGTTEATAGAQPQPADEVDRTKPEPTPIAPEPEVITPAPQEVTPAPALTPSAPEAPQEEPQQLPKTASPLNLIGLIGLLSTSGSVLIGSIRRRSSGKDR